ncbi:MAG: hypothetical protein QM820_56060 [Minicystis sp.]
MSADVPKIKGLAFIEALKWYAKMYGQPRLTEATKSLPRELASFITQPETPHLGLLPGSWYPSKLVELIFAQLYKGMTPQQKERLAADFAKASIANTLTGFYATFMRMLVGPDMIAKHFQKVWQLYQSTGRCEVIVHAPMHFELRISDWPGHTQFFCDMAMFASRNVLEVIGCKNVKSTTLRCVDRRPGYCAYDLTWTMV